MKDKVQKSYILLGNLPIDDDFHSPNGCYYVINVRVKYEQGVVSIQFIEQTDPETFSVEKAKLGSEIELDISSIIKLKTFLKVFTQQETEYIKVFSTRLSGSSSRGKGAFIKQSSEYLEITMDDKNQKTFKIPHGFQFESFRELINESLDMLKQSYIQYDILKVSNSRRGTTSTTITVDDSIPKAIKPIKGMDTPRMPVPPETAVRGTVLSASAFVSNSKPITLPTPVTTQVVPQAPDFNINIPTPV